MRHIAFYKKDPVDGQLRRIFNNRIPLVVLDGVVDSSFIIKNISDRIVSNVTVEVNGEAPPWLEIQADAPELQPGATTGCRITANLKKTLAGVNIPVSVDCHSLPVDITYSVSDISTINLVGYFEFTEYKETTQTKSSFGDKVGTVSDSSMIKGVGFAFFAKPDDKITIDVSEITDAGSIFIDFFANSDKEYIILKSGNLSLGITEQRRIFADVGEKRLLLDKIYENYLKNISVGLSFSSGRIILTTLDGEFTQGDLSVSFDDDLVLGESLIGEIYSLAIYKEFKSPSKHKSILRKISC